MFPETTQFQMVPERDQSSDPLPCVMSETEFIRRAGLDDRPTKGASQQALLRRWREANKIREAKQLPKLTRIRFGRKAYYEPSTLSDFLDCFRVED